jgi:hypothetical protein
MEALTGNPAANLQSGYLPKFTETPRSFAAPFQTRIRALLGENLLLIGEDLRLIGDNLGLVAKDLGLVGLDRRLVREHLGLVAKDLLELFLVLEDGGLVGENSV